MKITSQRCMYVNKDEFYFEVIINNHSLVVLSENTYHLLTLIHFQDYFEENSEKLEKLILKNYHQLIHHPTCNSQEFDYQISQLLLALNREGK